MTECTQFVLMDIYMQFFERFFCKHSLGTVIKNLTTARCLCKQCNYFLMRQSAIILWNKIFEVEYHQHTPTYSNTKVLWIAYEKRSTLFHAYHNECLRRSFSQTKTPTTNWPGFNSSLWPFAACHPHSLPHFLSILHLL